MAQVELRGRLDAADLALLFRIQADLRLGAPTRALGAGLVIVLSALLGIGLLIAPHAPDRTARVVLLVVLIVALADLLGMRLLRYKLAGWIGQSKTREHVARFDEEGLTLAPTGQEDAFRSYGWPLLEVLSLSQALVITQRQSTVVLALFPGRDLPGETRQQIEALARATGAPVLDGPRGKEAAAIRNTA
jgi:hypothetical protein